MFALASTIDIAWWKQTQTANLWLNDQLIKQAAEKRPRNTDIIILDIDQKSLEQLQDEAGSWPWPRALHAELVEGLMRQRPRAVVFDLLFNERDSFRPDSDALFNDVLSRYPNVYVAMQRLPDGQPRSLSELPSALGLKHLGQTADAMQASLLLPLALRQENWRGGLVNFLADVDGVGRAYWVWQRAGDWRIPSLPARVVHDTVHPLPDLESIRLNWRRPGAYRHISYADLYRDLGRERPLRPADEFKDKIVIVGTAAPGLHDFRPTPLGKHFPAVDILATAVDNLQQGDWLRTVDARWQLVWLLPALVCLGWRFETNRNPWQTGAALTGFSLLAVAASYALLQQRWWLPPFSALFWLWLTYIALAFLSWQQERQRQQQLIGVFSRVMDPRVVQDLVRRGEISQDAQSREITVLFSDIRGFTSLSEKRSPEQVVALLNRYFTSQVEIVFRHGGTLDKFIGDAIMAFWGAPVSDADHARHAVAAALEMSLALDRFKQEMAGEGVEFDIGIGLHSGPAVVGFIGSKERLDYTSIGDAVNLASRIEGQTKGVARVLVSQATRDACQDAFLFADRGEFSVKGREQSVRLFEPSLR